MIQDLVIFLIIIFLIFFLGRLGFNCNKLAKKGYGIAGYGPFSFVIPYFIPPSLASKWQNKNLDTFALITTVKAVLLVFLAAVWLLKILFR